MATLHTNKCTCGLPSQLMNSIDGRTIDTIMLKNGSKVHGVFFTDILYEIGVTTDLISRFQIFQYKTGAIDFKIETKIEFPENLSTILKKELLKVLDKVNIIIVDYIPNENTGKFKYIKTELE